jgi:Flp pilus assembly secretin CpaC
MLLSPTNLFLRGKKAGSMNIILQDASGVCYLRDIVVAIDTGHAAGEADRTDARGNRHPSSRAPRTPSC